MNLYFAGPGEHERPSKKEFLFVCGNEAARESLERAGAKAVLVDDSVFLLPEGSPVRAFALKIALSWYKDETGADLTLFRGVSLGKTVEGLIWIVLFAPIGNFARAARALLDDAKPTAVCVESSLETHRRATLERLCRERGVEFRLVAAPAAPSRLDTPRFFSSLFSKWPLADRSAARRILNRLLPFVSKPRGKHVLISYYYTLEPLISALGAEPGIRPVFYDWAGRRLPKLAAWTRWRFLEAPAGAALEPTDFARLNEILRHWDAQAASPEYAKRFVFDGMSCSEPMLAALRRIIVEDFPFIAEQQAKLQAALDADPPELVVVPYDANPPERLLLQEAKRRRIPSALFVHGIACAERPPFFDTEADHVFIGGAALKEFFSAANFPAEKVHDIGFPLFDAYAAAKRKPLRGPARVLVLSSFFPVRENIAPIVDILRNYRALRVTIKLHPGEKIEHYRRILGDRLNGRFELAVNSPMTTLLRKTDLVIGAPSTAMIEAVALKIPVLVTNFQGAAMTPPFDGRSGLPLHRTPEELALALSGMLPDRVPAATDHKDTLTRFAGRIDGKAAARGVSSLLDILCRRI